MTQVSNKTSGRLTREWQLFSSRQPIPGHAAMISPLTSLPHHHCKLTQIA